MYLFIRFRILYMFVEAFIILHSIALYKYMSPFPSMRLALVPFFSSNKNTGFVKSAIQYVKVHMNKLLQMYRFQ